MILLKSTVCLLLIIAFPEANSVQPTCHSDCKSDETKEDQDVEFWCQVPSEDGGAPVLNWDLSPIRPEPPDVRDQGEDGGNNKRGFTLKVVAPVPQLFCYNNADDPITQCNTDTCNILYSPQNARTSPTYSVSPGENITCTADGNPPPTFKWQQSTGDGSWTDVEGANGETITGELKEGATFIELRCVAMNNVNDKTAVSDMVLVSKYGKIIRTVIIICVVVGVVVVGVISAIIYKVKGGGSG